LTVRNKKIMGRFKSGWLSTIFVWLTFIGMFVSAIALFFTFGKS
jgi:Mn2+/Fe2+ NRAMP family transporter